MAEAFLFGAILLFLSVFTMVMSSVFFKLGWKHKDYMLLLPSGFFAVWGFFLTWYWFTWLKTLIGS